ncbi:hypothetical protein [Salinarimonas chemoclinalis]|uniref:hypothetical protein n=1 Tax=Salinarimonas chemoclinalis TaxID=3241599 RepID=UPI003556C7ED
MIGLIVHELATNAIKHGALAAKGGRVEVAWSVSRLEGADMLEFRWREHTTLANACSVFSDDGFGSVLLRRAAPAQLRGKAELALTGEGLLYRLEVPVP